MTADRTNLVMVGLAAALVAGCGGSQPPIGAPGAMPQAFSRAAHADRGKSWMLREAKSENLLYVSDNTGDEVYVYSYPKPKLVGTLTGFDAPGGECVDSSGDIFITNFDGADIIEYAHGGSSPIGSLSDSGAYPFGCSVDPTTGNLAVANLFGPYSGYHRHGDIAIYAHASGTPKTYTDPKIYWYHFCTYDNKGNLFVDGYKPYAYFLVADLPSGKSALQNLSIAKHGANGTGLQWYDGRLAILDSANNDSPTVIDQVKISGSKGTIINRVSLDDSSGSAYAAGQLFILNGKAITPFGTSPNSSPYYVGIWPYPTGGDAITTVSPFDWAEGVSVSLAKKS